MPASERSARGRQALQRMRRSASRRPAARAAVTDADAMAGPWRRRKCRRRGRPGSYWAGSIVSNCVALRCVALRIASSRAEPEPCQSRARARARAKDQSPARLSWADLKRADPAKPGARMRRRPPRRMPAGGPASAQIAAARGCRSRADEPAPARRRRTTRRNHRADRLIHVVSCIQTFVSTPCHALAKRLHPARRRRRPNGTRPVQASLRLQLLVRMHRSLREFPSPPLAQRAPNLRR